MGLVAYGCVYPKQRPFINKDYVLSPCSYVARLMCRCEQELTITWEFPLELLEIGLMCNEHVDLHMT